MTKSTNSNIFEYGGRKQYNLIQPYLQQITNLDKTEDFIDSFMNILEKALTERAEKENLPVWVVDKKDYIMKSEIVILCGMLKRLRLEGLIKEDPEKAIMFFELQKRLCIYGESRHWDLNILKHQVFCLFANNNESSGSIYTDGKICKGSDYN